MHVEVKEQQSDHTPAVMRADLSQAFEILSVPGILASMSSLADDQRDEQWETATGNVLIDELKAILEYVRDIPALEEEVLQIYATVNDISNRLNRLERVAYDHDSGVKRP